MDKHATAKHTDDKHHVLGKHTAFKHKIYDAVISYIDNQGVYRIVYCPSMRYKPAINDRRNHICNVERNKWQHNLYDDITIACHRATDERFPFWHCNQPYRKNHDKIPPAVFHCEADFVVLLDDFRKAGNRHQEPAPDKVVCHPVVSGLRYRINHLTDHYGVDKIVQKNLNAGKRSNLAPILQKIFPRHRKFQISLTICRQYGNQPNQSVNCNFGICRPDILEAGDKNPVSHNLQAQPAYKQPPHQLVIVIKRKYHHHERSDKSRKH